MGFEANGGVLPGTDIRRGERYLAALPTRDAMLPILCALREIVVKGKPLEAIGREFGFKAAASSRLQEVPTENSAAFVARLEQDSSFRSAVMEQLGGADRCDSRDGLRMTTKSGEVVHFRPSGNAPELRIYVEAPSPERASILLQMGLEVAQRHTR